MLRSLKPPRIPTTSTKLSAIITTGPRPRTFTSSASSRNSGTSHDRERYDPRTAERVQDQVDVCIVGAGPAGLSAAIRLKQLEQEYGNGNELRVVVLEKASEVGAHTLSGAVIEPRALNELLPTWKEMENHPLTQPATSSKMLWFTKNRVLPMPHPPQMNNTGNYVVSLSQFTSWLGTVAEEMGVEIYPGFAGAAVLYDESGKNVKGIQTNEVGLDKSGRMKSSFEPGMEFLAKVTLFAEGAHGSLTKSVVNKFNLRKSIGADDQTYGMGVKEVWRVKPENHRPGETIHTMGFPLDWKTYGGGWLYHMDNQMVSFGLVIDAGWANPYLSPYKELQKMKFHPYFQRLLEGGERIGYGARVINEGGIQSLPKLHFPGGALIGCSAGFVNVPKIKGTHNAMKSGMLAAEAAFKQLTNESEANSESETNAKAVDMSAYETELKKSWVWKELNEVRNLRPSFNTPLGIWGGMAYSGVDSLFLKGRVPWTFRHRGTDAGHTKKASECKPIEYPTAQPPYSTDLLTSVSLTSTNHAEDQPVHLKLPYANSFLTDTVTLKTDEDGTISESFDPAESEVSAEQLYEEAEEKAAKARSEHVRINVGEYAGLLGRACPAGVYEYVEAEEGEKGSWNGKKLVINSQNCIHCKLCDIKVPTQDITWTVPEGGGGPKYSVT